MGRIGKQKRQLIEQANKRLLGEETKSIDAVKKINGLKDEMEDVLQYYSKNGDVVTDEKGNEVSSAPNLQNIIKQK